MNAKQKFDEQFGEYELNDNDAALKIFIAGFNAALMTLNIQPDAGIPKPELSAGTLANLAAEKYFIEYKNQLHIMTIRCAFVDGYLARALDE
jgi:hypothetical protein